MNPKDIDQLIDELLEQPVPSADQARKDAAIQVATSEFAAQSKKEASQGFEASTRPIDDRDTPLSKLNQSIRSFFMNILNNRMAYSAFGTAAIAFVAVSVVFIMPSTQTNTRIEELVDLSPSTDDGKELEFYIGETNNQSNSQTKIKPLTPKPMEQPRAADQSESGNSTVAQIREIGKSDNNSNPQTTPSTVPNQGDTRNLISKPHKPKESFTNSSLQTAENKGSPRFGSIIEYQAVELQSLSQVLPQSRERFQGAYIAPGYTDWSTPDPRVDDREEYAEYQANSIKQVAAEPVSTFSIDVDTASYSLVRNQLSRGYLPKPQAVRTEELINYFDYNYPVPQSKKQPFKPLISVMPWNQGKKLVHIGIKGYDIPADQQPNSNLVFLLDVSGSMNSANKLPLVKQSISLLLDSLKPNDTVGIVVYAGAAGTVLEPTKVKQKNKILAALQGLNAGGYTAGAAGIKLAYNMAEQNFNEGSVNRIILATDGDFNVGQQSNEDLKTLVARKRDSGVFLSVLGFGRNNYQDDMMQALAQNGNGVAAYIDRLSEAKKVLVDEATSTLFPIAKDVKIQVEFNPGTVSDYRLIGYETRHLNREDFNNDKVDAGDIGAGHSVTAIYEVTPANAENQSVDETEQTQTIRKDQR